MIQRVRMVIGRYGWRAPGVTLAIGLMHLYSHIRSTQQGIIWKLLTHGQKGKRIILQGGARITPGCHIRIGDDVHIGTQTSFELTVNPRAEVMLGNRVWLSANCLIVSMGRIVIGDDTLIGEFVSLRDSTHQSNKRGQPIRSQGDRIGSIQIEEDVWIGRGCLIQGKPGGVTIGRGAIVGANSVVTTSIPPYEVWGGVPARYIRKRFDSPLEH